MAAPTLRVGFRAARGSWNTRPTLDRMCSLDVVRGLRPLGPQCWMVPVVKAVQPQDGARQGGFAAAAASDTPKCPPRCQAAGSTSAKAGTCAAGIGLAMRPRPRATAGWPSVGMVNFAGLQGCLPVPSRESPTSTGRGLAGLFWAPDRPATRGCRGAVGARALCLHGPCSTTLPWRSTATWSAARSTTSMSWVTSTRAKPRFALNFRERSSNFRPQRAVQRRGGLIGEDEFRVVGERHGDEHPLLLSPGQGMGIGGPGALRVGQLDLFEQGQHRSFGFGWASALLCCRMTSAIWCPHRMVGSRLVMGS